MPDPFNPNPYAWLGTLATVPSWLQTTFGGGWSNTPYNLWTQPNSLPTLPRTSAAQGFTPPIVPMIPGAPASDFFVNRQIQNQTLPNQPVPQTGQGFNPSPAPMTGPASSGNVRSFYGTVPGVVVGGTTTVPKDTVGGTTGSNAGKVIGRSGNDLSKFADNQRVFADYSYSNLDKRLGAGFTDQFHARMGADPVSWYARIYMNYPNARDPEWLANRAANAAYNDAVNHPWEVEQWQKLHGNVEIPQEMWERFWRYNQSQDVQNYVSQNGVMPDGKPVVY